MNVAPLTAPGVSDACYKLTTSNGDGDVLWTADVCAAEFGARGSITYIGACDAKSNPNKVKLILSQLKDTAGVEIPATSYTNPCPTNAPCEQQFQCAANADATVAFNLTVLLPSQSDSGFADIAVNLDTISCSAKADCPTALLFDPQTNERVPTGVVAVSCSAQAPGPLLLYATDAKLTCKGATGNTDVFSASVDLAQGPGYIPVVAGLTAAASYVTTSTIAVGTDSVLQATLSVAVAPDPAYLSTSMVGATACSLSMRVTASDTPFSSGQGGYSTPAGEQYPYIDVNVPIAKMVGNVLTVGCQNNPLGGTGSGVQTVYTSTTQTASFAHEIQ